MGNLGDKNHSKLARVADGHVRREKQNGPIPIEDIALNLSFPVITWG